MEITNLGAMIDESLLVCRVEEKSPNTVTACRETLGWLQSLADEESFPGDVRLMDSSHLVTRFETVPGLWSALTVSLACRVSHWGLQIACGLLHFTPLLLTKRSPRLASHAHRSLDWCQESWFTDGIR